MPSRAADTHAFPLLTFLGVPAVVANMTKANT